MRVKSLDRMDEAAGFSILKPQSKSRLYEPSFTKFHPAVISLKKERTLCLENRYRVFLDGFQAKLLKAITEQQQQQEENNRDRGAKYDYRGKILHN